MIARQGGDFSAGQESEVLRHFDGCEGPGLEAAQGEVSIRTQRTDGLRGDLAGHGEVGVGLKDADGARGGDPRHLVGALPFFVEQEQEFLDVAHLDGLVRLVLPHDQLVHVGRVEGAFEVADGELVDVTGDSHVADVARLDAPRHAAVAHVHR